jgi:parvulin-like peptidyl-prolyl isomerase
MKKVNLFQAITAIAFAAAMCAFSAPAFANKKQDAVNAPAANVPEVAFVGNDANSSTFYVSFKNGGKVKFELMVRDVNGDVLYRNDLETENSSTYFKLLNQDYGNDKHEISIRVLPDGKVHTFEVNSNVKTVKNVIVVKQ